ncbi:MAG: non-ribosomal peptide synthetase, partial [Deltaproteobacteria bacterium]|nr:non-ribosomal peptide synthetase [Deltaproteobacteria bacterium]
FDHPRLAAQAARIEELRASPQAPPPLSPATAVAGDVPPLSFAQERLWLLDRLVPERAVYNLPELLDAGARLDLARLERSLLELVRRHEVLRTTFAVRGGVPVQEVHGALRPGITLVELRDRREARRLAAREAARPFDLERGPLLRAVVLRLDDRDLLLLNRHHIVSDAGSQEVFRRELAALYDGRSLPQLPLRYADFAVWQRRRLAGSVRERLASFWRRRLDGLRALDLPTDRPRPAVESHRGALRSRPPAAGLGEALRGLGRAAGATLFMTLVAGFTALLGRIAQQRDPAVGTPVSHRHQPQLEGLIGLFLNTLVLRADLRRRPSFREHTARIRDTALDAFAHQELPFERLV